MADSPTTRTLKQLRKFGAIADVAEHWNPHAMRRKDLFGFVDIVAVHETSIIAVQCTAYSGISARVNKIVEECAEPATAWLNAGGRIEVWGWRKLIRPINGKSWIPVVKEAKLAGGGDVIDFMGVMDVAARYRGHVNA